MKTALLFLVAFFVGAALAFGTRVALHEPYAETPSPAPSTSSSPDPHAGHAVKSESSQPESPNSAVINSVCPICGMDVKPALKPATYQGKLVGFGCASCPSQFAKDPDRYGPSALRNEVVKN